MALLWGGAAAAAYLAGVAAHVRYDLVGWVPALVMLLAASALGQALARRLREETLASIALAGAFAAPFLLATTLDRDLFLLVYARRSSQEMDEPRLGDDVHPETPAGELESHPA